MKLWDKGYKINDEIEKFTVGEDRILDKKLAKYDIKASIAHAKMLKNIGILSTQELTALVKGLEEIQKKIDEKNFIIEKQFEDIHSKIEFELIEKVGDMGKKIHTARSRNDQILVVLHLYVKDEMCEIKKLVKQLFYTLITLSEKYATILLPGYTHLQVAMPSSFGLWFSGYAETLIDDLTILKSTYEISNQNPLGSAAGYGSSFPINREITTELLHFATMKFNSVAAQMSRSKLERTTAFALASLASTMAKLCADICLYMSENFGFLTFPKEYTTGSSIMPHKQNPDVFELIRAHCNKIQNMPNEVMSVSNNLTSGYHRDFQVLKENLIKNIDKLKECLQILNFILKEVVVKENILENENYKYICSVEEVNNLVIKGMPFRDAYKKVAEDISNGTFTYSKKILHTHQGSIGNLCIKEIILKFKKVYDSII